MRKRSIGQREYFQRKICKKIIFRFIISRKARKERKEKLFFINNPLSS
jgi:hypothetical protein